MQTGTPFRRREPSLHHLPEHPSERRNPAGITFCNRMPVDFFRAVFLNSPNLYALYDPELRYVTANQAYLDATGSSLEDLVGKRLFDVFPHDPDDPENESARRLRASFEKVLETRRPDELAFIRYRVPRSEGDDEVRTWSATHTPILDADGEVRFILQHTMDVTKVQAEDLRLGQVLGRAERVQEANVVLDAERMHLRRLFEQAPGFVAFLRGSSHVFDLANDAYYAVVGRRPLIGRPARDALPEIEGQGFFHELDEVYRTGHPYVARARSVFVQRAPGGPTEELVLDFVYQPIVDDAGAVTGIFVQGQDITEQKRLETERETALQELRFLSEAIPQHVWTALPDGTIDFVNRRALDYSGRSAADVAGSGWSSSMHPDDREDSVARWQRSLASGETFEHEFRIRGHDGDYRWFLSRAIAFRDAGGRIVKWFGTDTDIDDAKRFRDELLARAEYEQQLIGIVSHDLRNPLNAISMSAALLLRRGQLDAQQGKGVARIVSSAERAARLIGDFLDFAQVRTAGRIPVSPRDANVRDIVQSVVDELQLATPERHIVVRHRGEETGQWDPDRFAQAIGNVVANALQHGPADSIVEVVTHGGAEETTVSVHNDGAPIPPDDLPRLFAPFQRGAGSRDTSSRSVGLGLYISRSIVEAHGGTIGVRSSAGEGTTFTLRLPRSAR